MKSSIYISSSKIEVIGYVKSSNSILVKDYVSCPLAEGTMINGKITDYDNLSECLRDLRGKNPDLFSEPVLAVDGSSVLFKRMVTARLNKKQYSRLVKDEFADSTEDGEERVCDYHLLGGAEEGKTSLLACAVEKTQVESYITSFQDAGIKLKAVRVGVQAILSYIGKRQDLKEATFVLNVIDGVMMLSMIFERGVNVFMSRTRLYGENHEQTVQNILDNLSGLIQFNKSEKFNDIEKSLYLGISDDDLTFMKEINPYGEISFERLNFAEQSGGRCDYENAYFAYLCAILGDDSIDLIRGCKALDKMEKKMTLKRMRLLLICAVLIVVVGFSGFMAFRIASVNKAIKDLSEYINSDEVRVKTEMIDEITSMSAYYNVAIRQLEGKKGLERTKLPISNEVLDLVVNTDRGRVSIPAFSYSEGSGVLRVSGISASETVSAEYINALKESSLIRDIRYTGYSYSCEGQYNFFIDIILTGKEAE